MKKTYEIAGEVMGFFDAFKGSRPAINNESILIVRGRSRKVIPIEEFDSKLAEIGEKRLMKTPIRLKTSSNQEINILR